MVGISVTDTAFLHREFGNPPGPTGIQSGIFNAFRPAPPSATYRAHAIAVHDSVQAELVKIGLWAAPALLPYPLSKIAALVREGREGGARQLLLDHCTPKRLSDLTAEWWAISAFRDRRRLFEQALGAHAAGQYHLSVSALTPHIEGVVTDWLHANVPGTPWRPESKAKKFREVASAKATGTPAYRRVVESALGFILNGPALATFNAGSTASTPASRTGTSSGTGSTTTGCTRRRTPSSCS